MASAVSPRASATPLDLATAAEFPATHARSRARNISAPPRLRVNQFFFSPTARHEPRSIDSREGAKARSD